MARSQQSHAWDSSYKKKAEDFKRFAGTVSDSAIVRELMARNPDPKPGRWILPLIVIGMVAFTYLFVQGLEPTIQASSGETTTTTMIPVTPLDGGPIDTSEPTPVDAEMQAYLDQVTLLTTDLAALDTEMVRLNEQWDNREIEFGSARNELRDEINVNVALWSDRVVAAVPPASLTSQHQVLIDSAVAVNAAAIEVLAGLESSDNGEQRAAALVSFEVAVGAFNTGADTISG